MTAGPKFVADQLHITNIIPSLADVPLIPRSVFPPFVHAHHVIAFQDASESYGIGGWFFSESTFFYFLEPWPEMLGEALRERPRRWFITHGELVAEAFAIHAVIEQIPSTEYLTDFTDNDAAKGAANKGSSASEGMDVAAHWMDVACQSAEVVLRTERVTTLENKVADLLSRGLEQPALDAARLLGLRPERLRYPPGHPIWGLAVVVPSSDSLRQSL